MDFKILWSDEVLTDLQDAVAYLAQADPAHARQVGDALIDHIEILGAFPRIGPVFERAGDPNVRQIVCERYRIFYQIQPEKRFIEILHIWHGSRSEPPL